LTLQAIDIAETIYVSPISFYEISQKVRLGKWPEMAPFVSNLEFEMDLQGSSIAPLTPTIASLAGRIDWPHRDPFDRMLAATALTMGLVLVSADTVFDSLPLRRVW